MLKYLLKNHCSRKRNIRNINTENCPFNETLTEATILKLFNRIFMERRLEHVVTECDNEHERSTDTYVYMCVYFCIQISDNDNDTIILIKFWNSERSESFDHRITYYIVCWKNIRFEPRMIFWKSREFFCERNLV